MRRTVLSLLALALFAVPAYAQVPGPRVSIAFNPPANAADCSATQSDPWGWVYQTACYLPAGITAGTPWLANVRVTFTGATTVQSLVPRAQVVRETTAARCPGGATPCMRIDNLPAPAGQSNITVAYVTAEGVVGGSSAAVPFTAAPPAAPAASGLRVAPE